MKSGTITASTTIEYSVQGRDEVDASIAIVGTWNGASIALRWHDNEDTPVSIETITADYTVAWRFGRGGKYSLAVTAGGTAPALRYILN